MEKASHEGKNWPVSNWLIVKWFIPASDALIHLTWAKKAP